MIPLLLGGFLDNTLIFLFIVIAFFGILGLFSRSFLIGIFCAFLGYISITIESQYDMFITLLFIVIPAIVIIMSFQIYNMTQNNPEGMG